MSQNIETDPAGCGLGCYILLICTALFSAAALTTAWLVGAKYLLDFLK